MKIPLRAAALALFIFSSTAHAKTHLDLAPWPISDVFTVAVRFVRIDRGCKVLEKDEAAGYILFECEGDPGKPAKRGSLELFATKGRDGTDVIRAQCTLSDDPHYMEAHLLDRLERKLRDERGSPPPPKQPPPPPPPTDGGT